MPFIVSDSNQEGKLEHLKWYYVQSTDSRPSYAVDIYWWILKGKLINCIGMIQSPLIIKQDKWRHLHLESSSKIEFHPLQHYPMVSSMLSALGSSSGNAEEVNKTRDLEGSVYHIATKDHEQIQFLIALYSYETQSWKPQFHQSISTHIVQLYIQRLFFSFTCI